MSLVRSVCAALLVFSTLSMGGCAADSNLSDVPVPKGPSFESFFPKKVEVFGILIHATGAAPDTKVLHAAGVLAQYLDNDVDGRPDDPFLVETIVDHDGRLFMAVDRTELDAIFEVTEYIYWALTSLMGGQDDPGRLEEIGEEWKLNTPLKLAAGDPEVYSLLTDSSFKLPMVLPDGRYEGAPLVIDAPGEDG